MRAVKRWAAVVIAAMGVPLSGALPLRQEGAPVRVSVSPREGAGTTVCLQAAQGVRGRKRAHVSHEGGNAVLHTTPRAPGPDCVELASPSGTVTVELHFTHLWLIPANLPQRTFPAEQVRGKRITFTWLRD